MAKAPRTPRDTSNGSGTYSSLSRSKVSRACDACKRRRGKCSGTLPCTYCEKKRLSCQWAASYGRGRPPTPPPADRNTATATTHGESSTDGGHGNGVTAFIAGAIPLATKDQARAEASHAPASPGQGMTDTQGQYFDHTSSLAFLHRASIRLRLSATNTEQAGEATAQPSQPRPQHCAGDFGEFALDVSAQQPLVFPDRNTARELLGYYFDVCVVTYRFLHRPTIESWLDQVHRNVETSVPLSTGMGEMRAAVVLNVLAVAMFHRGVARHSASEEGLILTRRSNVLFHTASGLINSAAGYPSLESVQARLVQILFLLHSSRMNQAWYAFGTVVQTIAALGLHRRTRVAGLGRIATDYILSQCSKRSFWVAYVLDVYLGVMFGRPRHYRDEDLDQELPDCVNDEDMSYDGRNQSSAHKDSYIDSLICHVKIAGIVAKVSSRVYAVNPAPRHGNANDIEEISHLLDQWQENLPAIFCRVSPSSLVPPFQRQAVALKLAQSHATMYAFRPLILGPNCREPCSDDYAKSISECLRAAHVVLETVVRLAQDGTLYQAFWWTHYVTFVALSVSYGWQIQQQSPTAITLDGPVAARLVELPELADRCQKIVQHTGNSFMSKRYTIVLEELQQELQRRATLGSRAQSTPQPLQQPRGTLTTTGNGKTTNQMIGLGHGDLHDPYTRHERLYHPHGGQAESSSGGTYQVSSDFCSDHAVSPRLRDIDMPYNGGVGLGAAEMLEDAPDTSEQWSSMNWLDLDSLAMGSVPGLDILSNTLINDVAEFL